MREGFLYLVAIMDGFTCRVLAWRISNTLAADFCVEAVSEAVHHFGPPDIMNGDQGEGCPQLHAEDPALSGDASGRTSSVCKRSP